MDYLSICSGIEAASVAFEPLGWRPLAFSEIEAFPRAVLKHHYPDTPCHGDFTLLKDEPWIVDADMLCGGTPCQAFSVAGNRQSLADDRGNLTLQFVLLADAIDHLRSTAGREPAWILWENVPGVLSTNDNAFGAFLGGLVGRTAPIPEPEGGWTRAGVVDGPSRCAAWRTLDAQHFGVAQRRQRVFVLAKGGSGRWAAADALLPIIESSRWHHAPSRGAGEGVAATTGQGTEGRCYRWQNDAAGIVPDDLAASLKAKGTTTDERSVGSYVMAHGQANAEVVSDGSPSLTCNHEAPILVRMREGKEGGGKGPLVSNDQSLTLATGNDQVLAVRTAQTSANGHGISEGLSHTLDQANGQVLAFTDMRGDNRGQGINVTGDIANTMHCAKGPSEQQCVSSGMQVRRLTPVECERLQGFPDGYTNIPWRGKPESPDGPRYKALGNSWAVPCARWIGERIKAIRP